MTWRLPRTVHPFAWWGWAIAVCVAASATTNPWLLLGLIGVAWALTQARRGDNPWARGFKAYLVVAGFVVVVRVAYRVLLGGGDGPTILFRLPSVALPEWVGGIRLLGPVSLESVLAGTYDGLRLATIIVAVGAANSLANPKKLLAALPGALHETGTVLVIALSTLPQLGESLLRVQRVRQLRRVDAARRGRRARLGIIQTLLVPVLSDTLERSTRLAASMDARGYGRRGSAPPARRRVAVSLGVAGLLLVCLGSFLYLGDMGLGGVWWALAGVGLVACSIIVSGRDVHRTRYRPVPWRAPEWLTLACGVALVVLVQLAGSRDPAALTPSLSPPELPRLTWELLAGLAVALLPAVLTPPPESGNVPSIPAAKEER